MTINRGRASRHEFDLSLTPRNGFPIHTGWTQQPYDFSNWGVTPQSSNHCSTTHYGSSLTPLVATALVGVTYPFHVDSRILLNLLSSLNGLPLRRLQSAGSLSIRPKDCVLAIRSPFDIKVLAHDSSSVFLALAGQELNAICSVLIMFFTTDLVFFQVEARPTPSTLVYSNVVRRFHDNLLRGAVPRKHAPKIESRSGYSVTNDLRLPNRLRTQGSLLHLFL